jgi:antitoxin (DNA-binding transcriptional repressor) of toxin-antitoxin stability system
MRTINIEDANTRLSDVIAGLAPGEEVTIFDSGQPVATLKRHRQRTLPPGEGIRRSAGAWADDAEELDAFLKWNHAQRSNDRPPIPE